MHFSGRSLVPRNAIGTLQLLIRCSSLALLLNFSFAVLLGDFCWLATAKKYQFGSNPRTCVPVKSTRPVRLNNKPLRNMRFRFRCTVLGISVWDVFALCSFINLQRQLAFDSPMVTAQGTGATDNAVTGDQVRDWVGTYRIRNRPECTWLVYITGNLAV